MDILGRWRSDTRLAHERLEGALGPLTSCAAYVRYLRAMLGFFRPVEARLADFPEAAQLDLAARRRAHLAAADLAHLGVDPAAVPSCADLPDLHTWPRALGCLYVLEGSTLGARRLAREVERSLGLGPGGGAAFVHGHGERTGDLWVAFRAAAAAYEASSGAGDEMLAGAHDTFAALERWIARGA